MLLRHTKNKQVSRRNRLPNAKRLILCVLLLTHRGASYFPVDSVTSVTLGVVHKYSSTGVCFLQSTKSEGQFCLIDLSISDYKNFLCYLSQCVCRRFSCTVITNGQHTNIYTLTTLENKARHLISLTKVCEYSALYLINYDLRGCSVSASDFIVEKHCN